MLNWGKKKYPGQAPGINIGPRVRTTSSQPKPVMSKAGTPIKPSTPKAKATPGWTYGPHGNAPSAKKPTPRKYNPKMR